MTNRKNFSGFKDHRSPPVVIEYAVWLYFRFSLILRDVGDLLADRGIGWSRSMGRCNSSRRIVPMNLWVTGGGLLSECWGVSFAPDGSRTTIF